MSKWTDPDFNPYQDEKYLLSYCDSVDLITWSGPESINPNNFVAPGYEINLLQVASKHGRIKTVNMILHYFNVPEGLTLKQQIAWITLV